MQKLALSVLVLLTACSTGISQTAIPVDRLTGMEVEELSLPASGSAYLSPGGNLIAWTDGQSICIYTASAQKKNCAASKQSVDPNSVRWSPDEQRLVFTDYYGAEENDLFDEPDLWVMDVSSYRLKNLTPDQFDTFAPGQLQGDWDMAPRWSSDGQSIFFVRYSGPEVDQLHPRINRIATKGGAPQLVMEIENPVGQPMNVALALSSDGKHIGYAIDYIGGENIAGEGTWLSDIDGGNMRQLLAMPKGYTGIPFAVEFSADGRYLLSLYGYLAPLELMDGSVVRIVDIASGSELPALAGLTKSPTGKDWAAWAPAGSALAYLLPPESRTEILEYEPGLYLIEKAGEKGRLLSESLQPPFADALLRTVTWAANNTILVQSYSKRYLLIHLRVK